MVASKQKLKNNIWNIKEVWSVVKIVYKENCGFMKLGSCTFKPEHCREKPKIDDGKPYCDLYNVEFTSKAVKKELKRLKDKIKSLSKQNLKLSELKAVRKIEKVDSKNHKVIAYKKRLLELKDLGKGVEYLDKAYRYLKRCRR